MADMNELTGKVKDTLVEVVKVAKDGTTTVPDDVFDKLLDVAGLKKEDYKAASDLNESITAGFAAALAEQALPAFKSNKDLQSVEAKIKSIGRDSFTANIGRTATYKNLQTKEDIVNYGIVNAHHNVTGTKKGQVGVIKALVKQQYKDALGK